MATTNLRYGLGALDASILSAARDVGFDYAEVPVSGILLPDESEGAFEDAVARFRDIGLPVESHHIFLRPPLLVVGPDADIGRIEAYAAIVFGRMRKLGSSLLVFGSGGMRTIPDGWSRERAEGQFLELLSRLGPLAAAAGVRVAIEPLRRSETNFINTVGEGLRLVRAAGHDSIGVMADSFHWSDVAEGPEAILDARDRLFHAHVATFPGRKAPGEEPCDFTPFFRALAAAGYGGRVTIEAGLGDGFDHHDQLRLALETLRAAESAAR